MSLHLAPVTAAGVAAHASGRRAHPRLSRRYAASLCRDARRAARLDHGVRSAAGSRPSAWPICAAGCQPASTKAPGSPRASASARCWSASPRPISARFSASAASCCRACCCSSSTSLLGPLSPNLAAFLTMQFLGGVGSGTFIPLTISFIVRSLPARLVIYGHRALCDEFRAVAERRGLARGLVFRPLVVAVDQLAVLRRCCR